MYCLHMSFRAFRPRLPEHIYGDAVLMVQLCLRVCVQGKVTSSHDNNPNPFKLAPPSHASHRAPVLFTDVQTLRCRYVVTTKTNRLKQRVQKRTQWNEVGRSHWFCFTQIGVNFYRSGDTIVLISIQNHRKILYRANPYKPIWGRTPREICLLGAAFWRYFLRKQSLLKRCKIAIWKIVQGRGIDLSFCLRRALVDLWAFCPSPKEHNSHWFALIVAPRSGQIYEMYETPRAHFLRPDVIICCWEVDDLKIFALHILKLGCLLVSFKRISSNCRSRYTPSLHVTQGKKN